ncbi:MAG: response regulator transcription factor, partial [Phenylobacterium sp.]
MNGAAASAGTDPATVLVVEDDASLNAALAATLKAAGYRPVAARTAAEALRWFNHYAPDLVLLDLGLPDRDGLAVIAEIRGKGQTPIVVLSAREAQSMKVEALDLGADDYVSKPFSVRELLARVRVALRHSDAAGGRASATRMERGSVELDLAEPSARVRG